MSQVIFIKQKGSIVINSVLDHIRTNMYSVTELTANTPREIREMRVDEKDCIVVYAESSLAMRTESVIAIKDKIIESKAMLVLIEGDEGYLAVKELIPDPLITLKFMHPLDAKTIGPVILRRMELQQHRRSKKIMVVDDSEVMLTLAKSWLEDKYEVTLANSGTMAIKYLSLDRPDLILLDYEMPIVSGKTIFEMIRSEADFASIPVIFLTGQNDKQTIMEVLELKPDGYLLKSMEPGEIIKAVDDFFVKHGNMGHV